MRLLIDTHAALWLLTDDRKLTEEARRLVLDAAEVRVSVVSLWEIGIKHQLAADRPGAMAWTASLARLELEAAGCRMLSLTAAHAVAVDQVPPLHGDPFDRLLVAQAKAEPMSLLTHDRKLAAYSDLVILF